MEDRSGICTLKPSPFDQRDWKYEAHRSNVLRAIKIPKKYMCPNLLKVKNQGSRGTCVAMTLSCVKEYQESMDDDHMKGIAMSPNSLYIYRSTTDGGMYVRNALKILSEKGMCLEVTFPYGKDEPKKIPDKAVKEALNYKIKSYARIETLEGAKKAILEYGPLIAAFPYYDNGKYEFWEQPQINTKTDGGHAVAIVGWNEDGFIIRNSWGDDWNGNGHVVYPFSQWGVHWEMWSCMDEDTNYVPEYLTQSGCLSKLKFW